MSDPREIEQTTELILQLPAHEQAARRGREQMAAVPYIPVPSPEACEQVLRPGHRKTLNLNLPNLRH